MEESSAATITQVSINDLHAFIVSVGSLLFSTDVDNVDRCLRTEEGEEILNRFIADGDTSLIHIISSGAEGNKVYLYPNTCVIRSIL
jgi:hypothetical protein